MPKLIAVDLRERLKDYIRTLNIVNVGQLE
jgi:hypothetical protein